MDNPDLRQYLRNEHDVDRLGLVLIYVYPFPPLSTNPLIVLGNC